MTLPHQNYVMWEFCIRAGSGGRTLCEHALLVQRNVKRHYYKCICQEKCVRGNRFLWPEQVDGETAFDQSERY